MIQEIKYNGFTANPSDYECPDGDLAMSVGLVPEDGALKPVLPPKVLFSLDMGEKVVFIHKGAGYTHYIIYRETDGRLSWKDGDEGSLVEIRKVSGLKKIIAVGNVLVVSDAGGLSYFLFRKGAYDYMGDGIPSFPVYFSLKGESRREAYTDSGISLNRTGGTSMEYGEETLIFEQEIVANFDGDATYVDVNIESGERYNFKRPYYTASDGSVHIYYVDDEGAESLFCQFAGAECKYVMAEKACKRLKVVIRFLPNSGTEYDSTTLQIYHQEVITTTTPENVSIDASLENFNAIMATCNRFIASCHGDNKFIFPFFVRYSIVLFDGTETNVSPPVFMVPNYKMVPFLPFEFTYMQGSSITVHAFAVACGLRMHIKSGLEAWKDIVSGINIYATPPLFTYDQAATYEDFYSHISIRSTNQINDRDFFTISSNENGVFVGKDIQDRLYDSLGHTPERYVYIPLKEDDEIQRDVLAYQSYRKIRSYTIDEIIRFISDGGGEAVVDVELDDETLNNINTLPELDGTNYVFDKMYPSDIFSYNNRLVVSTNSERMFGGYDPCELNGYYDDGDSGFYFVDIYVSSELGGDTVVKTMKVDNAHPFSPIFWFYYPDAKAYKATISRWGYNSGTRKYYKSGSVDVELRPHDFLPGAYWFSFAELYFVNITPEEIDASEVESYLPPVSSDSGSKIQVSETNNPFVFNPENTIAAGFGVIFSLSSAARALSQGQFGQFPLYAFTTEGIWALEVSDTGTFSARQPITRDVCINPDSITQIDSAVLFATDRGIMLISGSETVCLSESINSRDLFSLSDLPAADKLVGVFNQLASEQERITLENSSLLPFREFLVGCRMIYDYTGQRILVYNPSVSYAYVYSLKSKTWGMTHSEITDNVNAYPDALAMVSGNKLVNFSTSDAEGITALIVTRPFKLGQPDVLKTIDTVIQRGYFRSGHVCQVLYGSRNLFDWHLLWSSTDKYLRGFRGSPYKYFRLALICKFDKAESAYGCSVQFTPRFTNKPR